MNGLGCGSQGWANGVHEAKDAQGRVGQRGKALCQAGTRGVVPILVPPAVLDEVQAVFHLPVAADVRVKVGRRDIARIEAGHEVPAFLEQEMAIGRTHFAIDAQGDLAVGNVQTLAEIRGVVKVEPKPADFAAGPLFSLVSWAGRVGNAVAKHARSVSSNSGWLALT